MGKKKTRKERACGNCGIAGHDVRTCPYLKQVRVYTQKPNRGYGPRSLEWEAGGWQWAPKKKEGQTNG